MGQAPYTHVIRVADLPETGPTDIALRPDAETCAAIAEALGFLGARKIALNGTLRPIDKRDWRFEGMAGATVQQTCVVTLEPVTTRIDTPVARTWLADYEEPDVGGETEMPEDDSVEPLGPEIDLGAVLVEAIALAAPDFPRKPDAELANAQFAEPGVTPLQDGDLKPFASLQALRDKLAAPDDNTD